MLKKVFIYSVGTVCFIFFILTMASTYLETNGWRLMSLSEATEFIYEEVILEDYAAFSQEEGLRTAKVIFGFPSKQTTFIWVVRLTKNIPDEKEIFFRKYSIEIGWIRKPSRFREENKSLVPEKVPTEI